MISNGAATLFALAAFIAGFATAAARYRHRPTDDTEPMGHEWGEIDRAASDAYSAVHDAITEIRARRAGLRVPSYLPRLILISDMVPVGKMELVDGDRFRALAGVDPESVLRALGHYPKMRWGDTIPERFTL